MVKQIYLELENQISEGTLFSSTFKVSENKVPLEYWFYHFFVIFRDLKIWVKNLSMLKWI